MIHELKTWPEYYQSVADGFKTFEVRKDDRNYKIWDYLKLMEWDPTTNAYTGRELGCAITYILRDSQFIKEGYVIMGLSDPLILQPQVSK